MPIPIPEPDETNSEFIARCLSDDLMREEYPDRGQRYAVCLAKLEESDDEGDG